MTRPIKAIIHQRNLIHNLNLMKKLAAGRQVWAVVKADAYGHGLENVIDTLSGADALAIIDIEDVIRAREAGWDKRIVLLQGFFSSEDLKILEKYGAEPVVHNYVHLQRLEDCSSLQSLRVHIGINSGMNRFGFLPEEVNEVEKRLSAIDGIEVEGIVTHFANACPEYDYRGLVSVKDQIDRLGSLAHRTKGACFANSAATIWLPECGGDSVRVGISLYGVSPDPSVSGCSLGLKPAMSLKSEVIAIQNIQVGESVGYGSQFTAKRETKIAVVACGFADGYLRSIQQGSPVWINGRYAPIVGNIAMDVMMIDVTEVPQVEVGTEVELWGEHLSVEEVAKNSGTIAAELLCGLTKRVKFIMN